MSVPGFLVLSVSSLILGLRAINVDDQEYSVNCDNLRAIVIDFPALSLERGRVINLEYGECNIDSNATSLASNGTGLTATVDMFACGMTDYKKGEGYAINVTFTIGQTDDDMTLTFQTIRVFSYCNFKSHYTALYDYITAVDPNMTAKATGEISLDIQIQSYNENYTQISTSKQQVGGSMVNLGLSIVSPNYDPSLQALAPLYCTIEDGYDNLYDLFHYQENGCANDNVLFHIDFDDSMWKIQHMLFLFTTPENVGPKKNNQTLVCEVVVCAKSDLNSVCNSMAKKCLDDDAALAYMVGEDQESIDKMNPTAFANAYESTFVDAINALAETSQISENVGGFLGNGTVTGNFSGNSTMGNITYDPLVYVSEWKGPATESYPKVMGYQEPFEEFKEEIFNMELDSLNDTETNSTRKRRSAGRPIPDSYDLRHDENCGDVVGIVRNQQNCGNCWAFSAVGVIQDVTCISSNGRFKHLLSTSELHQCSDILNRPGSCVEGSSPLAGFSWWQSHGLVSGSDNSGSDHLSYGSGCYPYVYGPQSTLNFPGRSGLRHKCVEDVCVAGFSRNQAQDLYGMEPRLMVGVVGGSFHFNEQTWAWEMGALNQQKAMRHIMQRGSVAMGMTLYRDFFYYSGGVYVPSSHPLNDAVGGHAVRVIGWGTSPTGGDYWLCVNSWGEHWGENGLFRIRRGENTANSEGYFFGFFYGCPDGQCANERGLCAPGDCSRQHGGTLSGGPGNKGPMNSGGPPTDGGWSTWTNSTSCAEPCGDETLEQRRTCSNPAPANGGKNCTGKATQDVSCGHPTCDDKCLADPQQKSKQFCYYVDVHEKSCVDDATCSDYKRDHCKKVEVITKWASGPSIATEFRDHEKTNGDTLVDGRLPELCYDVDTSAGDLTSIQVSHRSSGTDRSCILSGLFAKVGNCDYEKYSLDVSAQSNAWLPSQLRFAQFWVATKKSTSDCTMRPSMCCLESLNCTLSKMTSVQEDTGTGLCDSNAETNCDEFCVEVTAKKDPSIHPYKPYMSGNHHDPRVRVDFEDSNGKPFIVSLQGFVFNGRYSSGSAKLCGLKPKTHTTMQAIYMSAGTLSGYNNDGDLVSLPDLFGTPGNPGTWANQQDHAMSKVTLLTGGQSSDFVLSSQHTTWHQGNRNGTTDEKCLNNTNYCCDNMYCQLMPFK